MQAIFQSPSEVENGHLIYKKYRHFPTPITISGIDISGSDVDELFISFTPSQDGRWIVLSEIPLRASELPVLTSFITKQIGATISAIHNHWIVDNQGDNEDLLYLHFQMVVDNLEEVVEPLRVLWNYL